MGSSAPSPAPAVVRLPRSSTRLQKNYAHLKLVSRIVETGGWLLWEGKVLQPGGSIPAGELPAHPVILECVGPVGSAQRNRDWLWILWRLDRKTWEWREIARAQGPDNSAAWILREPALAAMNPAPALYEVAERARDVAQSAVEAIDAAVAGETAPVRVRALSLVYDQVAGRIAQSF